jgi:hypothetical protein
MRATPLQRHDSHGARVLGDLRLLDGDDVHDHAALEHLGQAGLDSQRSGAGGVVAHLRSTFQVAAARLRG